MTRVVAIRLAVLLARRGFVPAARAVVRELAAGPVVIEVDVTVPVSRGAR